MKEKRMQSKKEFAARKQNMFIQDIKNQNQMMLSKLEEKLMLKKKKSKKGKRVVVYED
jgi:hypothetical protein